MASGGSNLTGKFPEGKPMVGLIYTKKLNKIVNIFGELFNFTLELPGEKFTDEYHKMRMKIPLTKTSDEEVQKWKQKKNSGHVALNKYFEEDKHTFTASAPETFKTVNDFNRVYLGYF